jgi:U3 small nucleolar RNA-associated protein 14
MQSSRVNAIDEVVAEESHQRRLAQALAQSVQEESNVYDDDDDNDNDDDNADNGNHHIGGGFVILEAEET